MKKFKVLCSLAIGLLLVFSLTSAQQIVETKRPTIKQEATQAAETAKTEQAVQKAETQEATMATEEKEAEEAEEQKTIIFTLAPIVELDIFGVRLSLSIEPAGLYWPYGGTYWGYGWPYGYWWRNYYGSLNWWWNAWEWNYQGWYRPHNRNYENTNPIHASQLRDPRRTNTAPSATQSQSNQVKSYPSSKVVSRTQQKFNGRVAAKYAEPKQSPLLRKSSSSSIRTAVGPRSILSRTLNTRSSSSRISNQSRFTSSRTSPLRYSRSRISASPRISTPARSSATHSSVRSSAPRSTAVRSSGASRSSAPRSASPSRGGIRRK